MPKSARGVLFVTVFLDLLGYGIVIPLLPDFARGIGASAALVGLIVASYSAMQFLFSPLLGGLSDRFGRRPVLLATIALNGLAYLIFGFVESLALLLVSRLLAGIGGANLAVAQAYLSDITPPEGRAKAFGMIGAALGMGFVFGPPLGGLITAQFGTAAVGWFIAGLCALNLASAAILLPETRAAEDGPARAPVDGIAIVRASGALRRLFAVYFVFITGFGILTVVGALLWVDRFGLTAAQVGYTFGLIGVTTALVQGLIGRLTARVPLPRLLTVGLVLMAGAMAAMPLVPAPAFLTGELAAIVVFSIGYALVLPVGTAMVATLVDGRAQGRVLGLYQAAGSLARILGPLIGGAAYAAGLAVPFLIGSGLLAVALLIAATLRVEPRAAPAE